MNLFAGPVSHRKTHQYRLWMIYLTAVIALGCIPLISYICDFERKLRDKTESELMLLPFNGVWRSDEHRRIDNLDGTFDVITLNFTRLVNVPSSVSFDEFDTRWEELPRGLDEPYAFYGDFSNKKQDGCISWQDAVNRSGDHTADSLAKLHTTYVRQCGGWAGYEVATSYEFTKQQQSNVRYYHVYRLIARYQQEVVFCLLMMTVPACWYLFWKLAGIAIRSAARALKVENE